MNDASEPARWIRRFRNFQKANARLQAIVAVARMRDLGEIEAEAVVSRFATTWELGWKLLKNPLEYDGVRLEIATPRTIVRAAHEAGLLADGKTWFAAMDARNLTAHAYDEATFQAITAAIRDAYAPIFDALETVCRTRPTSAA